MNGTIDPNDDWADLARELGLENGPNSTAIPADSLPSDAQHDDDDDDSDLDDTEVLTEADEALETDDGSEADGSEEAEPGTKKRRRRRRRRKKKVNTASGDDGEELTDEESEDSDDDEEVATDPESLEENPTFEATRELIANWDVPSWKEIIGGLYRPR